MRITWRQYANDHPRVVDAALVAGLILAESGTASLNSSLPYADTLGWPSAVPLAFAGSLALLWRRSHPRAVVVFTALCVCAAAGVGYLITPVNLAPAMVALYELAVRVPSRTTLMYWFASTATITAAALLGNRYDYPQPILVLSPVLFLLLPVALGQTACLRQAHLEEEARHRVAEERMRIARELHDVVAHHLALANAQAGTAAYLARTRPDQVQQILTDLTGTTSAALRELKATVGLLRQPDDENSPLEPAPGLARLPELTASFAAAGLDVDVDVEGQPQSLSPDVDLTAYRIVQEALTNASKHASTRTAHIRLSYIDNLTITVTNATSTKANQGKGFGLVGMRERTLAAGGRFEASDSAGVFTVRVELPIPSLTANR